MGPLRPYKEKAPACTPDGAKEYFVTDKDLTDLALSTYKLCLDEEGGHLVGFAYYETNAENPSQMMLINRLSFLPAITTNIYFQLIDGKCNIGDSAYPSKINTPAGSGTDLGYGPGEGRDGEMCHFKKRYVFVKGQYRVEFSSLENLFLLFWTVFCFLYISQYSRKVVFPPGSLILAHCKLIKMRCAL